MNFETNKTHPNAGWRPWDYSTGPLSLSGKSKSSRNALKHGYHREVFREFRKNRRKPETIRIEGMCLRLIKADNQNDFEHVTRIVSDICGSTMKIWKSANKEPLGSGSLLELKYVFTLCESIIRYSTKNTARNLNRQLKEQYETK